MAARSDNDFTEKVRASLDIREIISDYLPLKKSGNRYRALCPFHSEKTPSFYVDAGKQLFYCFGCGTGGDAFKFLMLYEKVDFPEALRMVARRYGIPVPERTRGESSERRILLKVNRAAQEHFRRLLSEHSEGQRGLVYLQNRGLSEATLEEFEIGFAPAGWDGLKKALLAAGFSEQHLVLAGLLLRKEETGRTYDRFRDRVIFPIQNLSGECVGFGGRMVGEGEPKYLNSPETPLFRKGETLYGLRRTAEAIRKQDYTVLVEGYLDFLTLYQAGIRNLAATLGTGFTSGHVRLLSRFSRRVVVNFDPDSAGQAATRRSLELLLGAGFEVKVLRLPTGQDPDLFIREEGTEAYRSLLEKAPFCIEYLAWEAAQSSDLRSTAGKIEGLNRILPFVARLESPVERSEQIKVLSDALHIEEGLVLQELKRALTGRKTVLKSAPLSEMAEGPSGPAARLMRILIEESEARQTLIPGIRDEDLQGSEVEPIWHVLRDLTRADSEISYSRIGSLLTDPGDQARLVRLASHPAPDASVDEGRSCLKRLRRSRLARRLQEIQERLEQAPSGRVVDDLLRQKMDLRREIQALRSSAAP